MAKNVWEKIAKEANLLKVAVTATISFTIIWDFSMFFQILFSPQVKPCVIIFYKDNIYELTHDLPNDLRLRISGN